MKVREEIEKYAAESDKPVLLWLYDKYGDNHERKWTFVACLSGAKYEEGRIVPHSIWTPTLEGRMLYSVAHPPLPAIFTWPENQQCVGCKHSFWRYGENFAQDSMCALGVDDLINDCEDREPDDESE